MNRCPTERRQDQIAQAALRILAEEGARRLTAQHLAEVLQLTPGALFRHFPNMAAIIDALLDLTESFLFTAFPKAGKDPIGDLHAFFRSACMSYKLIRICRGYCFPANLNASALLPRPSVHAVSNGERGPSFSLA